jgi:hypothetical protein
MIPAPPYRGQKIGWKIFDETIGEQTMLFEIAVLHKSEEKKESIVVPIQSVLAKDKAAAERMAIKKVPEDVNLDEVTVLARPFG